jgi:hypothetical protein
MVTVFESTMGRRNAEWPGWQLANAAPAGVLQDTAVNCCGLGRQVVVTVVGELRRPQEDDP